MGALSLRRQVAARLRDRLEWCPAPDGVLTYRRGPLFVACNFGARPVELEIGGRLLMAGDRLVPHVSGGLKLPPSPPPWPGASPPLAPPAAPRSTPPRSARGTAPPPPPTPPPNARRSRLRRDPL